tara:strand:+ start:6736 stop:8448 length:1713 start_codon:yes stop_codon:yes gene_type:complete
MIFFKNTLQFLALTFLFFSQSSFSQGAKESTKDLSDSIRKYFDIDSLKATYFISEFIAESKKENNPKSLFRGYHVLASFNFKHNDTLMLIKNTDELFEIAKKNNLKHELLMAYHLKNNILGMKFGIEDKRIFNNIFEALKIAKEINSDIWECKYNQDIAEYYLFTGEFNKSLLYYYENLKKLKQIYPSNDYKKFSVWGGNLEKTYLGITNIYVQLKKLDSAKIYNGYAKSILDTTSVGYHKVYRFKNKINALEIALLEGNIGLAKKKYKDAFSKIPEGFNKSSNDFLKNYYLGKLNYYQGDFKTAIGYLESIDTIQVKSDETRGFFHKDLHKILYKTCLKLNYLKKADYYFEKHLSSLQGQMNINNVVHTNIKQNEIKIYKEEVESLKKQKKRQKQELWFIILTILLALLIIIKSYRKKQKNDKKKLELLLNSISEKKKEKARPKIDASGIKNKEVERILIKLNLLEDKKYFLRTDCTVANLAKKLKTNTTYLSKIINSNYQKSFTNYLNDLRINYVLNRLKEDNLFRKYSIQSIANEVGFKSKESFNAAFKKRTGVLPSILIKELNKIE